MPTKMDPRLLVAIERNDIHYFNSLCHWNEGILEQRDGSLNTVLHLATQFGNAELVAEIVKMRPDMVLWENEREETAIHEACRQGNAEVLMLLLNTHPLAAAKLNCEDQTAFLLACRNGHLNAAKLLLKQSWLMEFEEDRVDSIPLHLAISGGHIDIVEEILKMRPCLAGKTDKNRLSPLHYATSRGHLQSTKLLLSLDPDLALQYDNNGHTPLHIAVINGYIPIFEAFLSSSPTSFGYLTGEGETIFHLAIRFEKDKAFMHLARLFSFTNLLHQQDGNGNTILHLAVLRENYQLVKYIIDTTTVDINHQNHEGDILEHSGRAAENKQLQASLNKAGSIELSPLTLKLEQINPPCPTTTDVFGEGDGIEENGVSEQINPHSGDDCNHQFASKSIIQQDDDQTLPEARKEKESMVVLQTYWHQQKHLSKSCGNLPAFKLTAPESSPQIEKKDSPRNLMISLKRSISESRHRKQLTAQLSNKTRGKKEYEMYKEAVLNARNTIILVAILIATVTFSAGTNPPGGVFQEGPFRGKSTAGASKAFKVFQISNSIALFSSLSIVILLVSIIPFQRRKLMKLVMITQRLMWVAVSFTATAYISATWVVVPQGRHIWMLDALLAVSAGSLGILFIYLLVTLAMHRLTKLKWKEQNGRRKRIIRGVAAMKGKIRSGYKKSEATSAESTNSDVDSMTSYGYHAY